MYVGPDDVFLQPCQEYTLEGPLVEDALALLVKTQGSLAKCNADKKSVRDWKDTLKNN